VHHGESGRGRTAGTAEGTKRSIEKQLPRMSDGSSLGFHSLSASEMGAPPVAPDPSLGGDGGADEHKGVDEGVRSPSDSLHDRPLSALAEGLDDTMALADVAASSSLAASSALLGDDERLVSPVLSERSSRPGSASARRLRAALLQAQTRARLQEEGLAFVFAHVDARVRAAVRDVTRAKKAVRKLRKKEAAAAAAAAASGSSDRPLEPGEQTPLQQPPSATSPFRDVYLSALASPHHASATSAHAASSSSSSAPGASESPKIGLASMPSLMLGSSLASLGSPVAEEPSAGGDASAFARREEVVDGSYCLLPYEPLDPKSSTGARIGVPVIRRSVSSTLPSSSPQLASSVPAPQGVSTMPHSSSHQAMLEAHAALQELQHQAAGSQPDSPSSTAPSSLQTSPQPPGDGSVPVYPSLPALHSSPLHSASSVSSGSFTFSGGAGLSASHHILATSPYHIAPSTSLPPLRKKGSMGSPQLQPLGQPSSPARHSMLPPPALSQQQQQQQQQGVGAGLSSSSSFTHLPSAANASNLSQGQGSATSSSSSKAASSSAGAPAHSPEMEAALQNLRAAQARFSTLAQFCAPLVLRSPSFLRLQEEETLRRLGVAAPDHGQPRMLLSEEELSSSAELQLDAIASQQALDGSELVPPGRSSDSASTGSPEAAETKTPVHDAHDASLVLVDAHEAVSESGVDTSPTSSPRDRRRRGGRTGRSSSLPLPLPPPQSSQAPPPTKAQEREAMKIFIRKLKEDIVASDAEDVSAASGEERKEQEASGADTSAGGSTSDITLEEALESCVLLHRHLTAERARLAALEHGEQGGSAQRRRMSVLSAQLDALQAQLVALRSVHSEANLKLRNLEKLLELLQVPVNDKGELAEGFELHGHPQSPTRSVSLWAIASLSVLFGSLWLVSSVGWKRIWMAVRGGVDAVPALWARMGLAGATVAAGSCTAAAAAAAGAPAAAATAANVASGVTNAAAASVAAHLSREAATQTAARVTVESATAATQTAAATTAAAQRPLWSHHMPYGLDAMSRHPPHTFSGGRFPLVRDFLAALSLHLVQIA